MSPSTERRAIPSSILASTSSSASSDSSGWRKPPRAEGDRPPRLDGARPRRGHISGPFRAPRVRLCALRSKVGGGRAYPTTRHRELGNRGGTALPRGHEAHLRERSTERAPPRLGQ